MPADNAALIALVAATALHTGFQLTVTAVVYPALARVNAKDWARAHEAHGRSIVGVVVVAYAALLLAGGWALLTHLGDPWVWLAIGGSALSMGTTALVAGPTHSLLDNNPDPVLIKRLFEADRVRMLGAVLAFAAAIIAALS